MRCFIHLVAALLLTALAIANVNPPQKTINVPLAVELKLSYTKKDVECLTRMIYNEARNQKALGQVAVAMVAINRTLSPRFKHTTICSNIEAPKQFVARKPQPSNVVERQALATAERWASYTLENYYALTPDMRSWLFFNSHSSRAAGTTIGGHTFYERFTR